jgi:ABC-type polysaccharide transport system permease subunit
MRALVQKYFYIPYVVSSLKTILSNAYYILWFKIYAPEPVIPTDHYEAVKIDDESAWKQFWHITLLGLSRVMKIQVFYQTISCLKMFGQVQNMTGGGPGDLTTNYVNVYRAPICLTP